MRAYGVRIAAAAFAVLFWGAFAQASDILLTVRNAGREFSVTREMLEKLPAREFEALLPGMDDRFHKVKGPLLREIVALTGWTGESISAVAIDKYETEIPMADLDRFDVITAMEVDGKVLTVRNKGPLWIVYPTKDHPELQLDPIYEGRSIWQLKEIEIK
ncbi:hypothetical protein [Rhizobium alvei]|uniref:Oxidoreductase molybdopterin-binding domain-containing protein n=1 Tax=Rhizobium alvei TaxID=1132659 RepID=A0ABT8YI01_9HYPH|nr:hypothetical protein [Rhizobium alvei]MDO6963315.1 hypothetical protein [Rhizobium alvei]